MTTTTARPAPWAAPDEPTHSTGRGNARAGGIFYLLTFAASIPALLMLDPILNTPNYIVGGGHDTQVAWACFLDFVNALTAVGSAVAVYPVVKRVNQSLALGFVMSRMIEAAVIMIGVVALLTVVTLHQQVADTADPASLTTTGHALVASRNWTFLFGPGFMACVNAVLFGTLLFRSQLVPRVIPAIGLVGAPVLFTADMLALFGHATQGEGWSLLAALPIATWELSVGFYLTFRGFQRSPDAGSTVTA